MAPKKKGPAKRLAAGRPPVLQRSKSISRSATKALINKHHLLQKRKRQAIVKGNAAEEAAIETEIKALGGIEGYQEASLQGQRHDRGGDSSRVLMKWLEPCLSTHGTNSDRRLRMLEVGALSTQNACSKSGHFYIERIDLNSQGDGILQQDFMERPLPRDESEQFDIISLSLVLNYVPEPKDRGEMLRRTTQFLRAPERYLESPHLQASFSSLFLVLPAPCVTNSRYLDEERLVAIMKSVGADPEQLRCCLELILPPWTMEPDRPGFPCETARSARTPPTWEFLELGRCPDWCPESDGIPDLAAPAIPLK
ncbi:putative methyltransferase-domain-containing protein [Chaetomium tenue]|uniref:Methyltransferase-domain-containing protein n=1 Tax=Chaetomium tenue TaxID=1854479 RepID=A0ACB7P1Z4_9PEZI|nr:putative methyltransferase-domain-containing protein [Chaetomium globosum]